MLDIQLAYPDFGSPGKIDLILEIHISITVLLNGLWFGLPISPTDIEADFRWVLAGGDSASSSTADSIISKLWRRTIEEVLGNHIRWSNTRPYDRCLLLQRNHYKGNSHVTHKCSEVGGYHIVQLTRKPDAKVLGESRAQAVGLFSFTRSHRISAYS